VKAEEPGEGGRRVPRGPERARQSCVPRGKAVPLREWRWALASKARRQKFRYWL